VAPLIGSYNNSFIEVKGVDPALLIRYADDEPTPYRVNLSCSNGYFATGQLTASRWRDFPDPGLRTSLELTFVSPPGAAAGRCFITTWDQAALRLTRAELGDPGSLTNSFSIQFA
jgi:hypothetical protein